MAKGFNKHSQVVVPRNLCVWGGGGGGGAILTVGCVRV